MHIVYTEHYILHILAVNNSLYLLNPWIEKWEEKKKRRNIHSSFWFTIGFLGTSNVVCILFVFNAEHSVRKYKVVPSKLLLWLYIYIYFFFFFFSFLFCVGAQKLFNGFSVLMSTNERTIDTFNTYKCLS